MTAMLLRRPGGIALQIALRIALRIALAAALTAAAASPLQAQRSRRPVDEVRSRLTRDRMGAWRLDLAPAVEDALDRYDRDFEPWDARFYQSIPDGYEPSPRQVPWAVIGDFNGDGRTDVALAGRDDRDALVLVILSTGRNRYRALEADREPLDPDDPSSIQPPVLRYMYPGRYVIADARLLYPHEIVVAQPAIQLTGARRPGALLLTVEREALERYYLSDRPAGAAPRAARPTVPAPVPLPVPVPLPRRSLRTGDSATRSR